MKDLPEEVIRVLIDDCWFIIPPKAVWKKFCEEMDFDKKYIPEPDDIPVIFRKLR